MLKYIPLHPISPEAVNRFWRKVAISSDPTACWLWTASLDGSGYGRVKMGGINVRAHRLAYFLSTGKDPGDLMVCHKCDVPTCCNPAHHFLGTNRDNLQDASRKGRTVQPPSKGAKNGNARLTAEQHEQVVQMIKGGKNNRHIARLFGVTHQAISRIRRGKSWDREPIGLPYSSLRRVG